MIQIARKVLAGKSVVDESLVVVRAAVPWGKKIYGAIRGKKGWGKDGGNGGKK